MSELPGQARVVIIGGGAVGASCLYHLARAGWTDAVLLEKNELTAGSTWHAAGNVPTFSGSWSVMNMQRYSTELYRGLAEAVDYPMNYHVTGSIRLGHSRERRLEFERVVQMGRHQGIEMEMLAPGDIKGRYPFVETHDLSGVLYDPTDGDIDPAQLTQALAKGARAMGARVVRFCPVTAVRRDKGEWVVSTPKGEIRAEKVVNAAGYYAAQVGAMFGRRVPMMVMSHQYLLFETVPELEAWSKAEGRKLPLLRDVDTSYYLRQEKMGFNLGPYERGCRAHWVTPDDPFPEDFSFQLFPDDLERLEFYIADAMARVPLLAEAGLSKVINGPIPYTPDGNPLIGPMPGVPDAYEACVFTFGICQAGGAGKVLTEWITEGATEWDMWSCDPRRFTGFETEDYCVAKGMEVYGHEYAIHFPTHAWPAGRPVRTSPVHDQLEALGGQFGAYNGWERAMWYARPGDDTSEEAQRTWDREGPWWGAVAEECAAVRDGVGVLDLPGFTRLRLTGKGARAHLDSLTCSRLPANADGGVARTGLLYFADPRGRIVTEMTVLPFADDDIGVITAAVAQSHDAEGLRRGLPDGVALEDWSERIHCFIVTGPKARDLLAPITEADLSLPWLSVQYFAKLAGRDVALVRVSFAGELGWEVHCDRADAPAIFQALIDGGAVPFGMFALDSLRIEKGYRAWKGDLSTDYSLLEGGLERFIDWSKDFPGKAALMAEKQRGVAKRLVSLTVTGNEHDAPYMSSLRKGGEIVGEVTSGGWGHRVGRSIALGTVRADLAAPGTELEIGIFGKWYPAVVHDGPHWDAKNERLRA